MALQLVEGQDFAGDYSLLSQLYRRDRGENWLALDAQSGERVVLKVFDGTLPEPTRNQISGAITATRGLVHPNIARVYRLGEYDGNDYIACQYVRHGTPFDPVVSTGEDLQERWPWIEQLLDAVSFAHGLGLAHGHLHPGNILVDEQGRLAITDFGLPASVQHEDEHHAYLSPQVIEAATPDPSDDIYSLGQLLIVILTGRTWRNDEGVFEPTRPIPTEIRELVRRMLSDNAYDRPHDLATIRDVLKRFMLGESDAPLEPAGEFRRREPPRTQAAAPETQRLPHERRGMSATTAIAGLALLILLAAGLFLVLPEMSPSATDNPVTGSPARPSPATAPANQQRQEDEAQLTPMEQARREQMETQGAKLAKEILRLQVELEDVGVHLDQMGYDESATLTSRADEAYRAGEFDRALALYEEAKQKLVSMQASIPDVKAENMTAGDQAIKQGRSEDAIRAFTIVTAIDPEDSESRDKLALAENLDALLGKLGDAEYLEQEGKLREAEEALQSTLDMEPDWSPAKTALARVRDRIDQRRFNDAMSVALAALENEAFDEAREAFGKARDIRPESPEPADGLQQIEIAEQQRRIRELRSEAERQIGNENWDDAAGTFEEILEIDDALVFARQGHERATERHELDQTLERFIEQPTVMADDDELRAARRALSRAARIDDPGDRLSTQIDKLSHYISMARIPVEVELRSDGRTRVTVYRYGELGRLESHTIEVIPGQYTVVGKRPGYQDVERKLTVLGGRDMDPVYIACTEEI